MTSHHVTAEYFPIVRSNNRFYFTSLLSNLYQLATNSSCSMSTKSIFTKLNVYFKFEGELPKETRFLIWKTVLRLPLNTAAYQRLKCKGNAEGCLEKFVLDGLTQRLLRRYIRLFSDLCNWCPILKETQFLPMAVLRFSHLLPPSDIGLFEIVATIIMNICQNWFDSLPTPPKCVLNEIERILLKKDPILFEHFKRSSIEPADYGWPLVESFLATILTSDEWAIFMDNVVALGAKFLFNAVVAYHYMRRNIFLKCKNLRMYRHSLYTCAPITAKKLIANANEKNRIEDGSTFKGFIPLGKGTYRVLKPL